ncbi:MAG: J domain-containing protein [Acidimicrobiales bacterium]|nr:J domain-containing protein [Acidimicrobiales bacterium]
MSVSHYEELEVAPTATTAEIRTSYLALAREHHPDRLTDAGPAVRAEAAERMSRINAAWTVLSDRERRASYDRARDRAPVSGATIRDVDDAWTPYDDEDDIDPRLLDDTPIGAPTLRRGLAFLPAGLAAVGFAATIVGSVVGVGPLAGIGVILLVCSGLAFLFIPLVALAKSSRADRL